MRERDSIDGWRRTCQYLASSVTEPLKQLVARGQQGESPTCATVLAGLTNPAAMPLPRREASKADVASLRVEGDRAFVIYRGLEGKPYAISMAREGDTWKVASLSGLPLS